MSQIVPMNQYQATRMSEAREAIIMEHVPLVHFVLGRLGISRGNTDDYEDLVSQGLLGLIEAADHFDPSIGAQFSTYATLRVRGQVLDHLRAQDWLSRTARRRAHVVQQAVTELWGSLKRTPTDEDVAQHLGLGIAEVQQALTDAGQVFLSLDTFNSPELDDDATLHDVLPDENQPDPAQIFDNEDLISQVKHGLNQLPERQRLILSLYYHEELTLKEIGAVLGITESRVCQLHARAILNLKALLAQEQSPDSVPPAHRSTQARRWPSEAVNHVPDFA